MNRIFAIACTAMTGVSLFAGGYGVGLQTSSDQGNGNAIVPRVDFLHATDSKTVSSVRVDATANIPSLGVDYNYFPGKQSGQGFYLLAGLGVARVSLEVTAATAAASTTATVRKWTAYPEAGLGFDFTRHIGLELLYRDIRYHDVDLTVAGFPVSYSFSGTVQASLMVRF
jgi:type V secretory pathway adhesin AidA